MKNYLNLAFTAICTLLTTLAFSIDIVINSFVVNPISDCFTSLVVDYDLNFSNIVEDGDPMFPGDLYGIIIHDADCNVIFWSFFAAATEGNEMITGVGSFDNITTFEPASRPFIVSFYDVNTTHISIDPATTLSNFLELPVEASLVFDPSNDPECAALTDKGSVSCTLNTIPTLGEWGLILLSLLILIIGTIWINQRVLVNRKSILVDHLNRRNKF